MKKISPLLCIVILVICSVFTFAACGKVEFKVNFMVDNDIYATIDTNGKEVISIPEDPSKEDYIFDGWFWDNGTWETPFTANSLLDASLSSNMSVYAKWTPIEYTATFKADGQTVGTATYTIEDSNVKNAPTVPVKNGYDGAWENYSIRAGGLTINAVYTAKLYTITWKNNSYMVTLKDNSSNMGTSSVKVISPYKLLVSRQAYALLSVV